MINIFPVFSKIFLETWVLILWIINKNPNILDSNYFKEDINIEFQLMLAFLIIDTGKFELKYLHVLFPEILTGNKSK